MPGPFQLNTQPVSWWERDGDGGRVLPCSSLPYLLGTVYPSLLTNTLTLHRHVYYLSGTELGFAYIDHQILTVRQVCYYPLLQMEKLRYRELRD